jgi:Tfp pilus assembly protein FimT
MPDTMQKIALAFPLTHVAILLQDPWVGRGWNLTELTIVSAVTAVAAVLAYRAFRWE